MSSPATGGAADDLHRRAGEAVAGLRFKAWQPASSLHPALPANRPLTFDILDSWSGRSLGGCRYHVAPSGRAQLRDPSRQRLRGGGAAPRRFQATAHTPGKVAMPVEEGSAEFPLTSTCGRPAPDERHARDRRRAGRESGAAGRALDRAVPAGPRPAGRVSRPDGRPRAGGGSACSNASAAERAGDPGRFVSAERHIRDAGISFRIAGDQREHPWPLGSMPLVIEAQEWRGPLRRADPAGRVDGGDPRGRLRAGRPHRHGHLPAAIVAGNPDFLHPLHGVSPPGGHHLRLYAADLARGAEGAGRCWPTGRRRPPASAGRWRTAWSGPDLPGLLPGPARRAAARFYQRFRRGGWRSGPSGPTRGSACSPPAPTAPPMSSRRRSPATSADAGGGRRPRHAGRAPARAHRLGAEAGRRPVAADRRRLPRPAGIERRLASGSACRASSYACATAPSSWPTCRAPASWESAALAPYLDGLCRRLLGEPLRLSHPEAWCAATSRGSPMSRPTSTACPAPRRDAAAGGGAGRAPRAHGAGGRARRRPGRPARPPFDTVAQEPAPLSTMPGWERGPTACTSCPGPS